MVEPVWIRRIGNEARNAMRREKASQPPHARLIGGRGEHDPVESPPSQRNDLMDALDEECEAACVAIVLGLAVREHLVDRRVSGNTP